MIVYSYEIRIKQKKKKVIRRRIKEEIVIINQLHIIIMIPLTHYKNILILTLSHPFEMRGYYNQDFHMSKLATVVTSVMVF